jgi:hypothetical protein
LLDLFEFPYRRKDADSNESPEHHFHDLSPPFMRETPAHPDNTARPPDSPAGIGLTSSDGPRLSRLRRLEGKLDVLRVECTKCDRKGRYHVHKLIEKYGRNGNMMKWRGNAQR